LSLAINSSSYLSTRLAMTEAATVGSNTPTNLVATNNALSDDSLELLDQAHGYLLLRDTVSEYSAMVSVVQVTQNDLDNLVNYLTDIQSRLSYMSTLAAGSADWQSTQAEIDVLEADMSTYLGSRVAATPDVLMNYDQNGQLQKRYFDTLDLGIPLPDIDSGELAVLEVDIGNVLSAAHDPGSCPVCAASSTGAEADLVPMAAPTTNSTSVTGAVATTASGVSSIETLRMSAQWSLSAGETLSYSYYTGNVGYVGYPVGGINPPSGATALAPAHEANLDAAFADWDDAVAFSFEKVTESGTTVGELRTAYTTTAQTPAGAAAFAYGPGNSTVNGDIWFDDSQASNLDFTVGGYGYMTALHEIGHAIGLSHPFDGGSANGDILSSNLDNIRNTLMSYTNVDRNLVLTVSSNGSGGWTANMSTGIYASTPMLYDVATVEYLYGVSTTTRSTDTTYSWSASPQILETIVDSGGVDVIDASNQVRSNIINLNAGSFSSIGYWDRAQQLSYYQGLYGGTTAVQLGTLIDNVNRAYGVSDVLYAGEDNVAIALSAVIENAIGGAADDTITGNSIDNRIKGNGGNDAIDGGGGIDTVVFNGNYADYTITQSGANWIVQDNAGSDGSDTLANVRYLAFADQTWDLTSGSAANAGGGAGVSSNSSSDGRRYVGRADIASGTTGEKDSTGQVQLLRPVSGRPSILQATPSNRITGDGGNNQLQGTKADDLLEAGAGNDYVMAGDGNDLIVGGNGEGDDVYIGGAGSDTIRYSSAKAGITVNLATGFAGTTGGGNAANIGTDHLSEIENLIGSHYSDHLTGDANNNEIAGNGGDDLIDGGAGEDTAVFSGARASYKVKAIEGGFLVARAGESVQVKNIEYLRFSDGIYRVGGGASQGQSGPMGQSHGIAGINITTQAGASEAIKTVDIALSYVNQQRSALGAMMNVLEARGNVLTVEKTNTQAARMQIMDTNYAFETAALARQMVLLNAGQAMLAMANQSGKDVLSLLR